MKKIIFGLSLTIFVTLAGTAYWLLRSTCEIRYLKPLSTITQASHQKPLLAFDFDGTLVESSEALMKIWNELADVYNYKKIALDQREYIRGVPLTELLKELGVAWYRLPFLSYAARKKIKQVVLSLDPVAGIKELLQALDKEGYALGIVTSNSVENVELFLKQHDLQMFSFVCSESGVFNKHRVFNVLKDTLKITSNQLIYVGDEVRDIDAARKGGIRVISVTWGHNNRDLLLKHAPDAIINHPRELINVLRGMA